MCLSAVLVSQRGTCYSSVALVSQGALVSRNRTQALDKSTRPDSRAASPESGSRQCTWFVRFVCTAGLCGLFVQLVCTPGLCDCNCYGCQRLNYWYYNCRYRGAQALSIIRVFVCFFGLIAVRSPTSLFPQGRDDCQLQY